MKTKLRLLLICFTLTFALQSKGQTLIQFWDFNQARPIDGSGLDSCATVYSYSHTLAVDSANSTWPLYADYSKVAGGKIVYSRPQFHYSSSGRDSTLEALGPGGAFIYDYSSSNYSYFTKSDSGFAEGNAYLKARNPSDSCYFYIDIPTTGYKGISMQYAISQSSAKGATYNIFSYSTDGGSTWKNLTKAMDTFNIGGVFYPDTLQVTNPTTSTSLWYPVQINFTSDAAVNNNPNFILRFRMAGATSTGNSGNDRYDNIAVWASSPAGIDEVTSQTGDYSIYPNPANSTVTLKGSYAGNKLVVVYSELGQKVDEVQMSAKQTSLNISNLSSGVYFANIFESATGKNYTVKFVKN